MVRSIFLVLFVASRVLECCKPFWVKLSGVVAFSFGSILLLASDVDNIFLRTSLFSLVIAIDCWVIWTETLKSLESPPTTKGSVSCWK